VTLPLHDPNVALLAARVARAFTHSHRLAFAQVGPDLTLSLASPNLRALMQSPPEHILGRPLAELFWEFVGAEATLRAVARGDEPAFQLMRSNHERAGGATQYLDFQVMPLEAAGRDADLLLLVEDVSETAQIQQQVIHGRNELRLAEAKRAQAVNQLAQANVELERLNHFKSFLLAMAAHDLSSPLTVIHVNLSRLQKNPPPEVQRELIAIARSQANQLTRLINNLLNLDKIEQGRLTLNRTPCDLRALIAEVLETLEPMAEMRELRLTHAPRRERLPLLADPDALRQILLNLGSNAVKYTPSGGFVHIAASVEGDTARLSVVNSGPGLSEAQMATLFEPYARGDNAFGEDVVGSGLGLFIVKTLVEAHNGHVEVTSRPGQDVTFTVVLPLT
jgi:signal transduction histidine kinase